MLRTKGYCDNCQLESGFIEKSRYGVTDVLSLLAIAGSDNYRAEDHSKNAVVITSIRFIVGQTVTVIFSGFES